MTVKKICNRQTDRYGQLTDRQIDRQVYGWTDRQLDGKTDGQGTVSGLADG